MPSPASSIGRAELAELLASGVQVRILDVRRAPAFEKNPVVLPGALRVPPDTLSAWAADSSAERSVPLVVYCVYGHEVSQTAAVELEALGFTVRFLAGGISEWQSSGGATSAGDA
ncbi:sulfurtransferase [Rhizobacter sp. AJA081-3]|uniref:rhodanese-like domain-containing protein n=1 Tax=Rhizobacter sp. AJA081-3 TaxID=2753607 RepID=UPI001AE072F1|nr:sulfurtransferase [Rhizobacter sp. AJA081-3]